MAGNFNQGAGLLLALQSDASEIATYTIAAGQIMTGTEGFTVAAVTVTVLAGGGAAARLNVYNNAAGSGNEIVTEVVLSAVGTFEASVLSAKNQITTSDALIFVTSGAAAQVRVECHLEDYAPVAVTVS